MIIEAAAELLTSCDLDQSREALFSAHQSFIEAHLEDDISLWRTLEAESLLSVSGGTIQTEGAERWERRQAYLENVDFTRYEDEVEPVLRIADDCSLAWMTVQVRVEGHPVDTPDMPFGYMFAWVYLWDGSGPDWRLEGVVSTAMDLLAE